MCSGRTPSMPPAQSRRDDRPAVPAIDRAAAAARAQQVHRRRADEARDERVRRALVELGRRRRPARSGPSRSSTTWSAIVIASTWSCVTYTIVMPSVRCSARISRRISCAQLRVEVRQRLVHQADRRLGDDRAAERDALLLAAGELRRLAVEQRRRARAGRRRASSRASRSAAAPCARAGRTRCSRRRDRCGNSA